MEAFSRVVELAAAAAVLFLYPVISIGQNEALILTLTFRVYTAELADGIRTHGYLTLEEYEEYRSRCEGFGILGEIRIETSGQRYEETAGVWYEEVTTQEEIMDELSRNGYVRFRQGDSLMIAVRVDLEGIAGVLYKMTGEEGIWIRTGGVIRDETEPVYSFIS